MKKKPVENNPSDTAVKNKTKYSDIYNDGWADDVELHYPEGSWHPTDDLEIMDFENTSPLPVIPEEDDEDDYADVHINVKKVSISKKTQNGARANPAGNTSAESVKKSVRRKKRKKGSRAFLIFMIVWLTALSLTIAVLLKRFYSFLEKYEATYQASRPVHEMEKLFDSYFEPRDMDSIYNMLSVKPALSAFETEEDVKQYMYSLIEDKTLSYKPTENYNEELPEYYIEADDYIIGKALFRKDPTTSLDYEFPVWYLSEMEFYTQPMEQFRITVPENYTVRVNGVVLDDTYLSSTTEISVEKEFFEPYVTSIVDFKDYEGDGLYRKPEVSILNASGNPAENIYADTENNIYSAEYEPDPADREGMEEFAIHAVSAYANYISQDLSDAELAKYFTPDNIFLYYAKNNSSRTFYTRHSSVTIENAEIRDFQAYSEDAYYCEVYLEQWMKLSYGGSEPEVVPTDCRIYVVKYNGEWKVNGIKF
ncbi:MAG: hypothetical protein J6N53_11260 [Lachnospiraceae bacterium]|nr:hypothetical protein [Lachnospiraceae bacterium]MBP3296354.1 hypothetical protein [Lachnospiraceae bacterium]